jgi:hypothetical protein
MITKKRIISILGVTKNQWEHAYPMFIKSTKFLTIKNGGQRNCFVKLNLDKSYTDNELKLKLSKLKAYIINEWNKFLTNELIADKIKQQIERSDFFNNDFRIVFAHHYEQDIFEVSVKKEVANKYNIEKAEVQLLIKNSKVRWDYSIAYSVTERKADIFKEITNHAKFLNMLESKCKKISI